ncbi:transglutaminase domain-containing protein [Alicyclobacillus hesperidum URH17-3-68]|nr:transglutaminase domain-containing protein [Alicyclobacillus hesperidum URH17-3-68]
MTVFVDGGYKEAKCLDGFAAVCMLVWRRQSQPERLLWQESGRT